MTVNGFELCLILAAAGATVGCVPQATVGSGGMSGEEAAGGSSGEDPGATPPAHRPPASAVCAPGPGTHPGPCMTDFYYDLRRPGIDLREIYFYSPTRTRLKQTEDRLADGVIEQTLVFDRDENGRQVSTTTLDATETAVERAVSTFDAAGRVVKDETLVLPAGTVRSWTTYAYAENGQMVLMVRAPTADDALPMERTTFVYDTFGRAQSTDRDNDGDGLPDVRTTYTYDGDMLTERVRTILADGTTQRYAYTYDASCNRLTTDTFENGSATPVGRDESSYACWGAL
jgi:hypothetical protein